MGVGRYIINNIIARFILLHIGVCAMALCMVVGLVFVVGGFASSCVMASRLVAEGKVVSAPLVHRAKEGFSSKLTKYYCFVQLNGRIYTVYRTQPSGWISELNIFYHPALVDSDGRMERIVEVPDERSWSNVFESHRGKPLPSASAGLVIYVVSTVALSWFAIAGYRRIRIKRPRAFQI